MHGKIPSFLIGLTLLFACLGAAGVGPGQALAASQAKKDEAPPLEDPRQLVNILQQAIDSRDATQVDSRINFNSIGVDFLNDSMPELNKRLESGQLTLPQPLPSLLGSLNASSVSARRPAQLFLCGELRKLVLYGVSSGYFAGNPLEPNALAGLDGGLFLNFMELKPSRLKFGPAILASQDDAGALLLTSLTDSASGRTYDLELMLVREGSAWFVYSLENAGELLEKALGK